MNRKDIYFLAVAIGIIALFTFLWMFSRTPPAMTARAEHSGLNNKTPRETCWSCHTPDSKVWVRHPKKGKPPDTTTPCSACHKLPESQVAIASFHTSNNKEVDFIWPNRQPR